MALGYWESDGAGRSPNDDQLAAWARALDLELVAMPRADAQRLREAGRSGGIVPFAAADDVADPPTSPAVRGSRRRAA